MDHIEFYLPFGPTINNYYVHTKKGVRISNTGKKYTELVKKAVAEQIGSGMLLDERIKLMLILFPPCDRRRDLDNSVKAIQDSLSKAEFWEDDCQIDQLMVFRGRKHEGGGVWVSVDEAGPAIPFGAEHIYLDSI